MNFQIENFISWLCRSPRCSSEQGAVTSDRSSQPLPFFSCYQRLERCLPPQTNHCRFEKLESWKGGQCLSFWNRAQCALKEGIEVVVSASPSLAVKDVSNPTFQSTTFSPLFLFSLPNFVYKSHRFSIVFSFSSSVSFSSLLSLLSSLFSSVPFSSLNNKTTLFNQHSLFQDLFSLVSIFKSTKGLIYLYYIQTTQNNNAILRRRRHVHCPVGLQQSCPSRECSTFFWTDSNLQDLSQGRSDCSYHGWWCLQIRELFFIPVSLLVSHATDLFTPRLSSPSIVSLTALQNPKHFRRCRCQGFFRHQW